MPLRRLRGALLRLVRRRRAALFAGIALVAPSAWIELSGTPDAWWAEALALVLGATGAALLWTGLVGLRPDWVDDSDRTGD
ncbi:MAG: hypothetical protein IT176_06220 [Acidobacteria bacterium]|nr:hypothetical protein [Acidobacteriota bacterium]